MNGTETHWDARLTQTPSERLRDNVYMAFATVALLLCALLLGVVSTVPGAFMQAVRAALLQ